MPSPRSYPQDEPLSGEYPIAMLESAWGIIANAGGGDWELEKPEWQDAAIRWRNHYHRFLSSRKTEHKGK
jgi:hypothetical protein